MKRSMLSICLLSILFSANAFAYQYTPDADVSFYAPFSQQPSNAGPGFLCETSYAAYYFSGEIEETARDQFIHRQEALLAVLDASAFSIYVMPECMPYAVSEGKCLVLPPDDETGMAQAIASLQAIHGEVVNYGLIYGTADALCKAAGLKGHEARYNDKGMLRFYNDDSHLSSFLLTYPSFTETWGEKATIPHLKDMAVRFCAFLAEKGELTSLLQEKNAARFNEKYIAYMNAFLQAAKAETQLYTHLPALQFGHHGESCPLIIETAHGKWYILKNFDDSNGAWLEWGFEELFNTIWKVEDDLSKADAALGITPVQLQFLFVASDAPSSQRVYSHYSGEGPLNISSIDSLVHEYTHACMAKWFPREDNWFLSELAATYFEIQGQKNPQSNLIYTLWHDLPDAQMDYWGPVLDAMDKGDPLSYYPKPREIYDYLCFVHEQYDLFTPSTRTLNSLRSFAYYLQDHYGNEKMGRAFREGTPIHVLNKDWQTLQQEWQQHLNSTYGKNSNQTL